MELLHRLGGSNTLGPLPERNEYLEQPGYIHANRGILHQQCLLGLEPDLNNCSTMSDLSDYTDLTTPSLEFYLA